MLFRSVDLEQRRALGVLGLPGRARVGDDRVDLPAHLLARREQADHVVVALAHLAAVQAGQQRDGLVHREVLEAIPPRVEYSLTPLGIEVANRLLDLIELVESHMPEVHAAQQDYDARRRRPL